MPAPAPVAPAQQEPALVEEVAAAAPEQLPAEQPAVVQTQVAAAPVAQPVPQEAAPTSDDASKYANGAVHDEPAVTDAAAPRGEMLANAGMQLIETRHAPPALTARPVPLGPPPTHTADTP